MDNKIKLGTGKIIPLTLGLAIPAMLGQFVNVIYSIVDRIYIGNISVNGELMLASVGICAPILTLITSFASLVGIGGSPQLSMKLGEKKEKEAQKILNNAFLLLVLIASLLTVIVFIYKEPLLRLFGASDTLLPYAKTYLSIYTCGTLFAVVASGLSYFIICQGFATTAMLIIIAGTVTNIILDPIFIFTFDLGIAGAAIATVLAQMLSCILAVMFLCGKRPIIRIRAGEYSIAVIKRIALYGFCPFIILATDSIILIAFNAVLQKYGGDSYVASATISQSFLLLITMPMLGISSGTQTMLSFNYGARNIERVKKSEWCILCCCIAFTCIMFFFAFVMSNSFATIFTDDQEMIAASAKQIKVLVLGIIPLAFQYAFVDGLTALSAVKTAVKLSLLRKSTYTCLIFLLPYYYGVNAAFYAEPITDTFCAIVTVITFLIVFPKILQERKLVKE